MKDMKVILKSIKIISAIMAIVALVAQIIMIIETKDVSILTGQNNSNALFFAQQVLLACFGFAYYISVRAGDAESKLDSQRLCAVETDG